MRTINRAAFIVQPRAPYLEWASSIDDGVDKEAKALAQHQSIYLVPEDASGTAETPPLEAFYSTIFEYELEAWCPEEIMWPQGRSFADFQQWFAVRGESIVVDLGADPLEIDEL